MTAVASDGEMKFETLTVGKRGDIAHVVLNRPDKRNALSRMMLDEIASLLEVLAADPEIKVVLLSGAGPSFCAGFDVGEHSRAADEYGSGDAMADYLDLRHRMDQLFAVWRHPKPVIAAVHGNCIGAGSVIAALADVTITADNARIGIPVLPLGGGFLTPTWVHLVGPKRAKEIAFEVGGSISGAEAVAWGFANRCVPEAELLDEAFALAGRFCRTPLSLLILKKAAINRMVNLSGFGVGAEVGALTDAVAHKVGELGVVKDSIRTRGVRQTIADFESGELNV
jgi:enoyl-CoA hydratase/carnithine racemase